MEADELPLTEDHATPSTPADEASKAVRRKFLERQRSQECDKELALSTYQCVCLYSKTPFVDQRHRKKERDPKQIQPQQLKLSDS